MKVPSKIYKFSFILYLIIGYPFLLYAQQTDSVFPLVKDSISVLLREARRNNNDGKFLCTDSLLKSARLYLKENTSSYEQDNFSVDSLKVVIESAIARNIFMRGEFHLAEKKYKDILETIPDSCHQLLFRVYTDLSSFYGMQKMYDLSVEYALNALEEAKLLNGESVTFSAHSNLGDTYLETGQYDKALEKFLEVKRLSVATGKNEIISSMKLGLVYYHQGKFGLAEEYFSDYIEVCKDSMALLYSVVLPAYCEILISKGEKEEAAKLILEAVKDERYTQRVESNYEYLMLLAELYPIKKNTISLYVFIVLTLVLLVFCLLLIWKHKKKMKTVEIKYRQLTCQLNELRNTEGDKPSMENVLLSHEQTLQLIGLVESLPNIYDVLNRMRQKADSKSVVLAAIKELQNILLPFNSDKIEKEIAYYIEQSNHKFYDKLKTAHPQLNLTDLRLCTLIKLGMNTKEIAVFTNKSVRGIESAKFRLRKKMDIDSSKDIYDYFMEIDK